MNVPKILGFTQGSTSHISFSQSNTNRKFLKLDLIFSTAFIRACQ